eukprot:5627112-Prymnesium_polylepis.1
MHRSLNTHPRVTIIEQLPRNTLTCVAAAPRALRRCSLGLAARVFLFLRSGDHGSRAARGRTR